MRQPIDSTESNRTAKTCTQKRLVRSRLIFYGLIFKIYILPFYRRSKPTCIIRPVLTVLSISICGDNFPHLCLPSQNRS